MLKYNSLNWPTSPLPSESLCIPADSTAQSKLLPSWGVLDMQGAFSPLQGFCAGPHGTLRELRLGDAGQPLEVVVTRIAKVGGAKAEVHGH